MSTTRRFLIAVATAAGALVAVTACATAAPVAIQPAAHHTPAASPTTNPPAKAADDRNATGGTDPTATGAGGTGVSPAPTAATTMPPDTTLPDERNAPACVASDLVMEPVEYGGAAMGSTGVGVWVDNHGKRPCYLQGEPTLYYRDAGGTLHRLPADPDGGGKAAKIVVDPTAPAEFWIRHTLNYGGYDPHSAACAHPMVYRNLSVKIGGVLVPVPTLKLDIKCGAIFVSDWELR